MLRYAFFLVLVVSALPTVAVSQQAQAPYSEKLDRLSEILGSLHFLRNLCGEKGTQWRDQMEKIIAAENPDDERRKQLIATFNRGYRSFDATYTICTESAIAAIDLYMAEGEELSREIVTQYGN